MVVRTMREAQLAEGGVICLKLLQSYERIVPDDAVPFRLVAAMMADRALPSDARDELHDRKLAFQTATDALHVHRGLLVAARDAVDACDALTNLADAYDDLTATTALASIRTLLAHAVESLAEMGR